MKRVVKTLTKRRVAARSKWRCKKCDVLVDEHYEIDHHVPLHQGGSNNFDNLVLLCADCHHYKTRDERIMKEAWLSIETCDNCQKNYSLYFKHYCRKKVGG